MKPTEIDSGLHLYKARIVERMGNGDDRLRVRPLPMMSDITETENLPCFPPMTKGTVINGWAEKDDRPKGVEPDIVTIVSNYDFTYGFVMCRGTIFEEAGETVSFYDSFNFNAFSQYISGRNLGVINYDDIIVQNWTVNDKGDDEDIGGIAEFYNFKNGNKYIVNTSGACIIMKKDKIFMRVGSPQSDGASSTDFSYIEMTAGAVTIKTTDFIVDATKINFGKHFGRLLMTHGNMSTALKGLNIQPIDNITV